MMIGIACMPLGILAIGLGTTPSGMIRDRWVFDHAFEIFFGGIFWCIAYLYFAMWLIKQLNQYATAHLLEKKTEKV